MPPLIAGSMTRVTEEGINGGKHFLSTTVRRSKLKDMGNSIHSTIVCSLDSLTTRKEHRHIVESVPFENTYKPSTYNQSTYF